jgi:hypothetical protein
MDAEFVCGSNLNANFIPHHLSNNQVKSLSILIVFEAVSTVCSVNKKVFDPYCDKLQVFGPYVDK